jgi:ppGpp synthetase/RelA/SpoT-type nucleotidyltranferase
VGAIEDFVSEYERQFDFWEAAAGNARALIESELSGAGLRAIVTSRAKSVDRLADKLRQRDRDRHYTSTDEIEADIVDRAGVRVALYFPGQMGEAERLIEGALVVERTKSFPDERPAGVGRKRFSGYGARHFHVRVPEKALPSRNARYSSAIVEVQVASVLMHAWSEVEHDLVYKPLEGELSPSELALLDQLNGLVLAGEIALEQLQKAGDERVVAAASHFRDHYELGEFLRSRIASGGRELSDTALGRVDILFDYLADRGESRAAEIDPYLELLEHDFEERPVAEQLADLMLSGDPDRYSAYRKARSKSRHPSGRQDQEPSATAAAAHQEVGQFIAAWAEIEALLNEVSPDAARRPFPTRLRKARARGLLDEQDYEQLSTLRELRNKIVHAPATVIPLSHVRRGTEFLQALQSRIRSSGLGIERDLSPTGDSSP